MRDRYRIPFYLPHSQLVPLSKVQVYQRVYRLLSHDLDLDLDRFLSLDLDRFLSLDLDRFLSLDLDLF